MLRSRQLIGRGGKVNRVRLSLVPGAPIETVGGVKGLEASLGLSTQLAKQPPTHPRRSEHYFSSILSIRVASSSSARELFTRFDTGHRCSTSPDACLSNSIPAFQ